MLPYLCYSLSIYNDVLFFLRAELVLYWITPPRQATIAEAVFAGLKATKLNDTANKTKTDKTIRFMLKSS